ncbi:urease accessory protein UreD [Nocardia sp. BMG51109]|uniref:urease accessory protein UreD n=1 Tax=Nocardia sp. BMG51109 TaxID=1056816 RepID=UPI000463BB7A|nr:urease accessory protein UreD [Nocardia sp. BMG51109]
MRTQLLIRARAGELPRIRATGGLAARQTGPDTVHLIGTAATPLGGDELDITVVVEPHARLTVRSVAATIALPGRSTRKSLARWHFEVAERGELDFDPEPTVIAGGADHETRTTIALATDSTLHLRERVQIGRTGENIGHWRGDLSADLADVPLLRHRLELGAGVPTDDHLSAPRALSSLLRYPDESPPRTVGLDSAHLSLASGGSLHTWTGGTLSAESPRPDAGYMA